MFSFHLELESHEPKFSHKSEFVGNFLYDEYSHLQRTIGEMFQDVRCISPEALISLY